MDCIATRIPYRQTGYFSKIVLDYIDQAPALQSFFSYPPTLQGLQKAIQERAAAHIDRKTLVDVLKRQYADVTVTSLVQKNLESLLSPDTFTITTAHQPNIFTGPLYFIYKILHAVKLAELCRASFPSHQFVPVYCMGSEDADLDELGHIYLGGQKLVWKTNQQGAVGRMQVDKPLLHLLSSAEGQLSVLPYGNEILKLLKECYREKVFIQDATFHFVNALFGEYGLVVLIPDDAELKKQMIPVFEDDLFSQSASGIVAETATRLQAARYKTQVNPREINLFYLHENNRGRIVKEKKSYKVQGTGISFPDNEIRKELYSHPEHFSPNVVLRGLYQETILPDIAFIGGGGEIAYWLQYKKLFEHYNIPFPVLVLRNSFLVIEKKWNEKISRLGFAAEDFFLSEDELLKRLIARQNEHAVKLNGTFLETEALYNNIRKQAAAVDSTLSRHVEALKAQTLHRLHELEKKMLRAEKRKYSDQQRQIHIMKEKLFPAGGLQERHDNLLYYFARWGNDFIDRLYEHSLALEQEFVILSEK
jgi:bacillithiol biosynthesis cysteine-adding enzyme BshC